MYGEIPFLLLIKALDLLIEVLKPLSCRLFVGLVVGGNIGLILEDTGMEDIDHVHKLGTSVAIGDTGIEYDGVINQFHHITVIGSLGDSKPKDLVVILVGDDGTAIVGHQLDDLAHHILVSDGVWNQNVVAPVPMGVIFLGHVILGHGEDTRAEVGVQILNAQVADGKVGTPVLKFNSIVGGVVIPYVGTLILAPCVQLIVEVHQLSIRR